MYGIPELRPAIDELNSSRIGPEAARDDYSNVEATENALDSALADTFPASDAISITQPGGGILAKGSTRHCQGERA